MAEFHCNVLIMLIVQTYYNSTKHAKENVKHKID